MGLFQASSDLAEYSACQFKQTMLPSKNNYYIKKDWKPMITFAEAILDLHFKINTITIWSEAAAENAMEAT